MEQAIGDRRGQGKGKGRAEARAKARGDDFRIVRAVIFAVFFGERRCFYV